MHRLILPLCCAAALSAQQPPATPVEPPPSDRLILSALRCPDESGKKQCELVDVVAVQFTNLKEWCGVADHDLKTLTLILDGRLMAGLHPIAPMPCDNELRFELNRLDDSDDVSKANRDAWNALLGRAHADWKTFKLSVGADGSANSKAACYNSIDLKVRIFPAYQWVVYLFLLALLTAFLLLAARSDILKDASTVNDRRPFSLARCQMAWWFFLVLCAYHYIWMVTGDHNSLTPGVLMLIGISAATGLGATMIDTGGGARKSGQDAANGFLRFANDILRENDGVSFHRFQLAVWTVVVGFVFAISVYKNLSMPDFSATLLGLMGISSGTYIGFKLPGAGK